MVRLLSTEQLQDQLAALAWLKTQTFVRPTQIAAAGNSFGGIETVLGVERSDYCAAVDASGGAESWDKAPGLRDLMQQAVQHSKATILFFQAENDYSLDPSRTLFAAMKAANKPAEIRIYPAYGDSSQAGHSFAYRGASIWIGDVVRFLDTNCKQQHADEMTRRYPYVRSATERMPKADGRHGRLRVYSVEKLSDRDRRKNPTALKSLEFPRAEAPAASDDLGAQIRSVRHTSRFPRLLGRISIQLKNRFDPGKEFFNRIGQQRTADRRLSS
jgi:dienelactone hydrolase